MTKPIAAFSKKRDVTFKGYLVDSTVLYFLHFETWDVNPSYFEYQDSVNTKGDKHSCSGQGLNMLQFLFLRAIEFVN